MRELQSANRKGYWAVREGYWEAREGYGHPSIVDSKTTAPANKASK